MNVRKNIIESIWFTWLVPNAIDNNWAGIWPFQSAKKLSSFEINLKVCNIDWYLLTECFFIGSTCSCKKKINQFLSKSQLFVYNSFIQIFMLLNIHRSKTNLKNFGSICMKKNFKGYFSLYLELWRFWKFVWFETLTKVAQNLDLHLSIFQDSKKQLLTARHLQFLGQTWIELKVGKIFNLLKFSKH